MLETMVEPPFTGNVYRSAGWINVGNTKGMTFKRRPSKSILSRGSPKRAKLIKDGKFEDGNYKYCGKSEMEGFEKSKPKIILLKPLHKKWKTFLNR